MRIVPVIAVILLAASFYGCSENVAGNGGGMETTNGIAGTILDGKEPVADVVVTLYSLNYNPVDKYDDSQVMKETRTDEGGEYLFKNVAGGSYNIVARSPDNNTAALMRAVFYSEEDSIKSLSGALLKETGSMEIHLRELTAAAGEYLYIPGVGVYGQITPLHMNEGVLILRDVPSDTFTDIVHAGSEGREKSDILAEEIAVLPGETAIVGPFAAWPQSFRISINTSSSGAGVSENVYNFPLLIRLSSSSSSSIFENADPDGADLRFTKSDRITLLPFELERWDYINGLGEIWVKLDTVYAENDSQFIYMYTGRSSAPASGNGADVFSTDAGFAAAWHLNENPEGEVPQSFRDRTVNAYHGTPFGGMTAANSIEGIVGPGLAFDGVDDHLDLEDITADFTGGVSVCAWANFSRFGNYGRIIDIGAGEQNNNIAFHNYMRTDSLGFHLYEGSTRMRMADFPGLVLDEWAHVCATCDDAGIITVYKDGAVIGIDSGTFVPRDVLRDSSYIAKSPWSIDDYFQGMLDEITVFNRAKSAAWIKLSNENQRPGSRIVQIESR